MSDLLEGGCACGAVRYQLAGPPMFVHCCHCRECQRHTGSAFVLNALIETNRVIFSKGELAAISVPTTSGAPHDIYHCRHCQTAIQSDYGRRPGLRFLRVGTLDDPSELPPDVHIFTSSRLPWVRLSDGAAVFEEYYDMAALWPTESLRRRQAAVGDVA